MSKSKKKAHTHLISFIADVSFCSPICDAWHGGKYAMESAEYQKLAVTRMQYDEYGYDDLLRLISVC